MVWLVVLFYWRRALRGWRCAGDARAYARCGLMDPSFIVCPPEALEHVRFEREVQRIAGRIAPIRLHFYPDAWTNPHADYFLRNLAAIRAEERLAMHYSRWNRFRRWIRRAS